MNKDVSTNCFAEVMIDMSERINNVEYEFLGNRKPGMCIVFPPAGGVESAEKVANLLSNEFDVMYVKGGYYGISPLKDESDVERFRFGEASKVISEKISGMDYQTLAIVGESVGALHAMELRRLMAERKNDLILFSPALYKKGILTPIHDLLLAKALKEESFFESRLFVETLRRLKFEKLLKAMQGVAEKIGPMSYLMCLKDITKYTQDKDKIKSLLKESLIIVGKKDLFFKYLCDPKLCQEGEFVYIDSDHSPSKEVPDKALELVMDYVNRER